MVTDTREIEMKYEAGPETVLPPLEDLPRVASEAGPDEVKLEAEYYDTADLRLLRAGVHLHELHDTLLHAKTCVIDGLWTTVGSSNLDWRSFLHNAEANLVVLDAGLANEMETVFMADVARAREIVRAEWARRGWRQRMVEMVARRFEFFL